VTTALDEFGGLLRWDALQDWVGVNDLPGTGPVRSVRRLTGGSQNEVFWCTRDGGEFVLRRPPAHPRPGNDETMRREARVLAALAGTDVPHPALYAACADLDVLGVCFFAMEAVDGFGVLGGLSGTYATDPAWRRAMGFALVDAAAALGAVDPAAVGLADFGRGEHWVERQVTRWRTQLEGYAEVDGYDPAELAGMHDLGAWLDAHRPADARIGVIHGDLHWANVLFARDAPRVAAVIDWELSSLGEPLLDLAWILVATPEPDDPPGRRGPAVDGLPTRAELVERYRERSGRDLAALDWFLVLACYKLGIILEGTHARARAGQAPAATGDALHGYATQLVALGRQFVDRA
jgi:aminoglycoside phosphotransferase (APT) family kinase protein